MLKILKRDGNPVEEAAEKIEESTLRVENIQAEIDVLIEKKRKLILDGKNATSINDEVRRLKQEAEDISVILLPSLNEKLETAKAEEEEVKREKRIEEIRADEEKLYAEIAENIKIITESQRQYQRSLDRLVEIKEAHNHNLKEFSEMRAQRNPNLDWNILLNFLQPFGK